MTRKRHANKEDRHRTPAATKRRLNADSPSTSPNGADKRACVNHTPPQGRQEEAVESNLMNERKRARIADVEIKRALTVYVKGIETHLFGWMKNNPKLFKRDLTKLIGDGWTARQARESVRDVCGDERQRRVLLQTTALRQKPVVVTKRHPVRRDNTTAQSLAPATRRPTLQRASSMAYHWSQRSTRSSRRPGRSGRGGSNRRIRW